jgi:hypothetical protein
MRGKEEEGRKSTRSKRKSLAALSLSHPIDQLGVLWASDNGGFELTWPMMPVSRIPRSIPTHTLFLYKSQSWKSKVATVVELGLLAKALFKGPCLDNFQLSHRYSYSTADYNRARSTR